MRGGFGLMMGVLVREPYHAITWSLFYVMPSVLFYVIPIGYAANDLRSLFVKGSAAGMELHMAATAYSLLIGNLYRGGIVQRIPVAICDLDDSPVSRELIRAVADADQYDFRQSVSDDAEAVNLLERGEVAAVLIIPEDFSGKFYRAESVSVAFLQDGSNTLQASYASAPIQLIGAAVTAEFNSRAAMINSAPQLSPAPVTMSLRTAGNPTQSYMAFYMYGVS